MAYGLDGRQSDADAINRIAIAAGTESARPASAFTAVRIGRKRMVHQAVTGAPAAPDPPPAARWPGEYGPGRAAPCARVRVRKGRLGAAENAAAQCGAAPPSAPTAAVIHRAVGRIAPALKSSHAAPSDPSGVPVRPP
jgi:hypothetical protein